MNLSSKTSSTSLMMKETPLMTQYQWILSETIHFVRVVKVSRISLSLGDNKKVLKNKTTNNPLSFKEASPPSIASLALLRNLKNHKS